jgi:hypothetical protein
MAIQAARGLSWLVLNRSFANTVAPYVRSQADR